MGYRSDVGLAITATALTELIEGDSDLSDKVKKCLSDADDHIKSEDGNHLFVWNDIKWYPFDDVVALERRLRSIGEGSFRFIRLGEDSSDVEESGCWYENDFNFGYIHQLTFDGC